MSEHDETVERVARLIWAETPLAADGRTWDTLEPHTRKVYFAMARAAIAALGDGWQDIASAPRDGTWFQAYRPAPKVGTCQRIVTMCWLASEDDFAWPVDIFDEYNPPDLDKKDARGLHVDIYTGGSTFTHWRPLPSKPEQSHDRPR